MTGVNRKTRAARREIRPLTVSGEELAEMLGISQSRINQMVANGQIAKTGPNQYDAYAAVGYYCQFLRGKHGADDAPGTAGAYKKDQLKQRARILKMEADERAGELVELKAVVTDWTSAAARVKQRLLSIPYKAAALVSVERSAEACRAIIENLIHDALNELASTTVARSKQKHRDGGSGDAGDLPPAAQVDGERVG